MDTATLTTSLAAARSRLPAVSYPPELPVSQHKDEIAAAIRDTR
jgi:ATP-dependent helicase HrpA